MGQRSADRAHHVTVAGDFNSLANLKHGNFCDFGAQYGLLEIDMRGITHKPARGIARQLDKWFIRDQAYVVGTVNAQARVAYVPEHEIGHRKVYLRINQNRSHK